jgi:hypothetical protein
LVTFAIHKEAGMEDVIRVPKLRLNKEILRSLAEPELRRIDGGDHDCSAACIEDSHCDCYDPDRP